MSYTSNNNSITTPDWNEDGRVGLESSIESSSTEETAPLTTVESVESAESVNISNYVALWLGNQQNLDINSTFSEAELSAARALLPESLISAPPAFVGLINEGCLCYLNSLLQLLFHLCYFRTAVYRMPDEDDNNGNCSIPQALKELFFCMQKGTTPAHTKKLTAAFGWSERELYTQHDIQEMATLLRDNLEEKMKGTVTEGAINQLFEGLGEQVVMTIDGTFESRSRDIFYDIHLPLTPHVTLIESLRSLTAKDKLVGDNKYRVEEPGKEPQYKDAEKSYEFRRFPPVIWFHLKRFEINLMSPSLEMKKVNSRLEFPVELDLRELEGGGYHAEDEEEEEKEEGNETKTDDNPSWKNARQQQPFSTNSPAIYDLQGVIVHRGSVRSGHYYCYIREWDHVQKKFTRWIEFDDDKVTVVGEDIAVTNNFGGPIMQQGRQCGGMAINNAYILSYVRRADCCKVLAPPPENSISQRVRDVFRREMLEKDRREREENDLRQKLTLFILTDSMIREHVRQHQRETFPREMRTCGMIGLKLEVKKEDTVLSVYEAVAAHRQLRGLHLNPRDFGLWCSQSSRCTRPVELLTTHKTDGETIMMQFLDRTELRATNVCLCLYLQLPMTLKPFPLVDANPLIKGIQSTSEVNRPSASILLRWPVALNSVTFDLECRSYREVHIRIRLCLYDSDNSVIEFEERRCVNDRLVFCFNVTAERFFVHRLDYNIDTPMSATSVKVSGFYLNTSPAALECLKTKYSYDMGLLKTGSNDVLLFLKYFNCISCRVVYVGSVLVPCTMTIGACGNVFYQLLGESGVTMESLQIFEEKHPNPRMLRNSDTLLFSRIGPTGVLVAQREEAVLLSRFPRYLSYFYGVARAVFLYVVHIAFGASLPLTGFSPGSDGDVDVFCNDRKNNNNNNNNNNISNKKNQKNNNKNNSRSRSRSHSGVGEYSSVVEVLSSATFVDGEGCDCDFYPPREFRVLGIYARVMDGQWKYEEVCEVIGTASGHDPNFIRLYRGSINSQGWLTPETDPAPTGLALGALLSNAQKHVLFFESLQESRRVVEARPRIIVTVRTEKNEPLYTENIVMRRDAVYGELVRESLDRCAYALLQHRCSRVVPSPSSTANNTTNEDDNDDDDDDDNKNHKKSRNNSSNIIINNNNNNNNNDNNNNNNNSTNLAGCVLEVSDSGTTISFTIGSHYLALLVDSRAGAIKEIIEVPLPNDGSCVCHKLIPFSVKPLIISLIPAIPLKEKQFRLACCHGEWLRSEHGNQPFIFGHPFVVTLDESTTVSEARKILLTYTGVSPQDVESSNIGVVMYTDIIRNFPHWDERLILYWENTENNSDRIPTLLLNHKPPREKPGSRYIVQNNPALRIAKK